MNKKNIHHHAKKHHEAHKTLKVLLSRYNPLKENIWPIFFITFIVVLIGVMIFRNWNTLESVVQKKVQEKKQVNIQKTIKEEIKMPATSLLPPLPKKQLITKGVQTGVKSAYAIERQASWDYRNLLSSVLTFGGVKAAKANSDFGYNKGVQPAKIDNMLKNSVWMTNYLSTGQHLTKIEQNKAKALQKSVLSTYYLGEKTVDIDSVLQTDAQILSNIKNTLSVDLFQYLNQSTSRADSLDEYLKLLQTLSKKTDQRINDLQSKIAFLTANSKAKAIEVKTSETAFFSNIKTLDGPNADKELKKFVGIKEGEVEIKAKLGAYKSLQNYYKFFKPKLDTRKKAVKANRDVLIAGVKVMEIQNMTLPLVIKKK